MDSEPVNEGVAIVGLAGRFPGACNAAEFWANLCAGRESISTFSDEQLRASGVTPEEFNDPAYVRRRAVLEGPEMFDAACFGIAPRDAELTDPQHRAFLECCWEAFEEAGQHPQQSGSVGVFASSGLNTYFLRHVLGSRTAIESFTKLFQADAYNILIGADKDYLATRVAYKLNLRGPALTVQTACSSSLVAVAQACASLQSYQCDAALAGGVSISFPQERGHFYQEGAIPSADGHCRAFDAGANGTVFGAGCGVVLLKRMEDALRDGNFIHAVIRSAAINNDGGDKMSFSAPSQTGQAEVIALAHALAGVTADSISYVEAHGTGTPLGDPIEVAALTEAFRMSSNRQGFCGLGSLKTNVGHLEAAAGVTGLIKVALALRHRHLPASLHFRSPNPNIHFEGSPFQVVAEARAWENVSMPRRAGVSSFGVGGTNAHAVVEEAPEPGPRSPARRQQLLVLSAKTATALDTMTRNFAEWLAAPPEGLAPLTSELLADAAFTLQTGREAFAHRRAVVVSNPAQAVTALRSLDAKAVATGQVTAGEPEVVFLFPGQGAQYVDMGRELYAQEPVFREELDRCAEILRTHLGTDIRHILHPTPDQRAEATTRINETAMTQPAIFVIEYALAKLWQSWGIQPSVLIGHSIGEYVCAVLAETFTLEDALALLATRAKLMQALPSGSMLAVRLPGAEVEPMLPSGVSIAAYNSAKLCTVSGPTEVLKQFQQELEGRKVAAKLLATSHAFHSAMMDPVLPQFTAAVTATRRAAPKLRWISSCTGTWITPEDMADPAYWSRQLRQAVRFADALNLVAGDQKHLLLEVGPGQALSQLARQHPGKAPQLVVSSFGPGSEAGEETASMYAALGRLWIAGATPEWDRLHAGGQRRRVPLPTYPFERKRFWAEPPVSKKIDETEEAPAGCGEAGEDLESVVLQQLSLMARQLERMSAKRA